MSDHPLPLSGLRVVDCTVDRGELASRLLGDLGAEVVKVEPPGGSPARGTAPVRRGVSLAFAVRNAGKRGVVLDLAHGADVERFHELLDHADVLVTSAVEPAPGLDARDLAVRHPHLVVGALLPFGLDGPYADWAATDATLAASGGFAFKAGIPEDSPLLPPGHLVDDAASITGAFGLLCALYQREATGAGQFVEVSVNEAIAQICDWSLPNAMARIEAGFPAGEVRNGNGPIYPIFACKGGYVRLIILSVRQWHAMREWLGEPEFLQDPALDGFVARREIAEHVLNPLFVSHFADLSMEEVSLEAQKRGIVCTPALTPADILTNEHFESRRTFVDLEVAPGVSAPLASGYFEIDGERAGPATAPPAVGEHTDAVFASLGDARPAPTGDVAAGLPLAGLRVMDFGHGAVGVEVGRRFAEYGAEVMKIESRTYTDFMRLQLGGETNPSFASSSRSKLGFGVNAKTDDGRALIHRLAAVSDLVVENNSTGTMDKLGIGFDALQAVNPGLVMVSSQLMGSHGAWSWWRGYGPSTQPPGGLVHLWNYADRDEPAGSMSIYPDHVAGCLGAVASLAALVGRARDVNAGVHVEVAQVETVTGMLGDLIAAEGVEPGSVVPMGNRSEVGAPWGLYRCAGEEEWLAITCRDDADWQGLVAAMGSPTWATDAAYAGVEGRRTGADEIDARIGEWTAAQSKDAVARACQAQGVPAAPMLTGVEMTTDAQYVARGFAVQIDQPGVGPLVLDGAAFRGARMAGPDIRRAPDLGEHTRQIAREQLGLDDDEIDRLLAAGVLETTPPVG
ncbi:MAG TPA: CoA transferase [Acidimicrobiia bacterium]|nr:CoA transferase [Acidimicrobiia bacterium]